MVKAVGESDSLLAIEAWVSRPRGRGRRRKRHGKEQHGKELSQGRQDRRGGLGAGNSSSVASKVGLDRRSGCRLDFWRFSWLSPGILSPPWSEGRRKPGGE